jgi:hypothetical protein
MEPTLPHLTTVQELRKAPVLPSLLLHKDGCVAFHYLFGVLLRLRQCCVREWQVMPEGHDMDGGFESRTIAAQIGQE